jgi:hypothetical protein
MKKHAKKIVRAILALAAGAAIIQEAGLITAIAFIILFGYVELVSHHLVKTANNLSTFSRIVLKAGKKKIKP